MAPTDYQSRDQTESTLEQIGEGAQEAGRRAVSLTEDIADAVKEHPYTALAVAAGVAFTVGALWKLGPQRTQRSLAWALRNRDNILPSQWRYGAMTPR